MQPNETNNRADAKGVDPAFPTRRNSRQPSRGKFSYRFSATAVVVLAASLFPGPAESQNPSRSAALRPNFLVIITDDHGYGDLGVHGNPKLRTPHLDRLARASIEFEIQPVLPKAGEVQFKHVSLAAGPGRLECAVKLRGAKTGVLDVEVTRIH
ncbi:MAG: hypothetical protein FJW26_21725 [Acidimicrobiia bacterium]|nr:hypothetical protein [Acidimicrobiia bacterium]